MNASVLEDMSYHTLHSHLKGIQIRLQSATMPRHIDALRDEERQVRAEINRRLDANITARKEESAQ